MVVFYRVNEAEIEGENVVLHTSSKGPKLTISDGCRFCEVACANDNWLGLNADFQQYRSMYGWESLYQVLENSTAAMEIASRWGALATQLGVCAYFGTKPVRRALGESTTMPRASAFLGAIQGASIGSSMSYSQFRSSACGC